MNKEVKQGSTTTISCVITGITDTATVTWRTSTGQVSGSGFTATQGSHSGGTQTSTLAVDGTQVNVDIAYTCRVTSGSLPESGPFDTAVNIKVFGKIRLLIRFLFGAFDLAFIRNNPQLAKFKAYHFTPFNFEGFI